MKFFDQSTKLINALTCGVLLWICGALLFASEPFVHSTLSGDDAGYYFGVARSSCLVLGWTFDGIHATNGFNPLFTSLLTVLYTVFLPECGLESAYRLGLAISGVTIVASVALLHLVLMHTLQGSALKDEEKRLWVAAAVFFYTTFVCLKRLYGLDAPFVLCLGLAYALDILRHGAFQARTRDIIVQGLLLGLLILARFDSLSLVAAFLATQCVLAFPDKKQLLGIVKRGLIAGATLLPWTIWSTKAFGTWMPVSAKLKTSFPHPDVARSIHTFMTTSVSTPDMLIFAFSGLAALIACVFAGIAVLQRQRAALSQRHVDVLLLLFSVYLVGRFAFMFLFSQLDVQGGYVILAHVYVLFVLAWGLDKLHKRGLSKIGLVGALGLLVLASFVSAVKWQVSAKRIDRMDDAQFTDQITFARALGAKVGEDAVLFGGKFGIMGYFAERPWVNKDGVIHNYAYQEAIRDSELEAYLERAGVNWIVMFHDLPVPTTGTISLEVPSHLYDTTAVLTVNAEDIVETTRLGERNAAQAIVLARYDPTREASSPTPSSKSE